jgi:5-methylcytosine-specific restriction protein A
MPMPNKPKHPCSYAGCPELIPAGERFCKEHKKQEQREYNKQRGSSTQQGYDARWQKIRKMKLNVDPLCAECLRNGQTTVATQVHHKDGNVRNNSPDNLESLCIECHSRITAKEGKRWEGGVKSLEPLLSRAGGQVFRGR